MDTPPTVSATDGLNVEWLCQQLTTRIAGCAHAKSNLSSCPLHDMPFSEPEAVIEWLDGLSSEEKDFLVLYHQCALVINWERGVARMT